MKKLFSIQISFPIPAPSSNEFYDVVVKRGAEKPESFRCDVGGYPEFYKDSTGNITPSGAPSYRTGIEASLQTFAKLGYKVAPGTEMLPASSLTGYAPVAGEPILRQAVKTWHEADFGISFEHANADTIITDGGTGGLAITFKVIAKKDYHAPNGKPVKVAFPTPFYPKYNGYEADLNDAGVTSTHYSRTNGLNLDAIETLFRDEEITHFVICDPDNPTGQTLDKAEKDRLIALAKQYKIVLLVDPAYDHLRYEGSPKENGLLDQGLLNDGLLVYHGTLGKTAEIPGERIGYMIASKPYCEKAAAIKGLMNTNSPKKNQLAATLAIQNRAKEWPVILDRLQHKVDRACDILSESPTLSFEKPKGSFYIWLDVSKSMEAKGISDIREFSQRLFDETEVNTVPGHLYGDATHIRISVAGLDADKLTEAMNRLVTWSTPQ